MYCKISLLIYSGSSSLSNAGLFDSPDINNLPYDLIMVHVELLSAHLLSFMFIDDTMNLEDFIDMNPDFGEGQVKDLNSFLTMFTS